MHPEYPPDPGQLELDLKCPVCSEPITECSAVNTPLTLPANPHSGK